MSAEKTNGDHESNTDAAIDQKLHEYMESPRAVDFIDEKVLAYLESPRGRVVLDKYARDALYGYAMKRTAIAIFLLAILGASGFYAFQDYIFSRIEDNLAAGVTARYSGEISQQVEQLEKLADSRVQRLLDLSDTIALQDLEVNRLIAKREEQGNQIGTMDNEIVQLNSQIRSMQETLESDDQLPALEYMTRVKELLGNSDTLKDLKALQQRPMSNTTEIRQNAEKQKELTKTVGRLETTLALLTRRIDAATGLIKAGDGAVEIGRNAYGGAITLRRSNGQVALRLEVDSLDNGKLTIGDNLVIVGVSTNNNGGIWIRNGRGVEITNLGSDGAGNGLVRTFNYSGTRLNELSPLRMPQIQSP